MGLTQEQKAALLKQSQVAAPEPAAVVEKPDQKVLEGAMAGGGESQAAKLRRLKREQLKAEQARLLAAQQASTPDPLALKKDAELKMQKADQLFAEHKAIDATWETDGDLDKWYGSKIAELEARLESNEAVKKLADVMNDYDIQSVSTANILDFTGQLAKNKKEYEQIQAGTHAWVKSADGSKWTFEETKAELAEGLEEAVEGEEAAELEPAVEESAPAPAVQYKPHWRNTPMYAERWQTIWGPEGEDVEYAKGGFFSPGPRLMGRAFRDGKTYRPRPTVQDIEGFFGGQNRMEVAKIIDQISQEHGSSEAMSYLLDWRQDIEDAFNFAHNNRKNAEEQYRGLIERTRAKKIVDPVEMRRVRKEYEDAYKDEVALHSVRQDLTAYMAGKVPEHLDQNSPAQRRIAKRMGDSYDYGGGRKVVPKAVHNHYVDNVRGEAADTISQSAQNVVDTQTGLSEQEKENAKDAIKSLMIAYSGTWEFTGPEQLEQRFVFIEPQYRESYKMDTESTLGIQEGAIRSPIGRVRELIDIGKPAQDKYRQAATERFLLKRFDENKPKDPSWGGTGNWANDAIDMTEGLTIKERQAVIVALQQATKGPKGNQFMIRAQRAFPTTGAYYPLRKAYLNAAKYDQLAVQGLIRMVEYGSTIGARQALPEAAR